MVRHTPLLTLVRHGAKAQRHYGFPTCKLCVDAHGTAPSVDAVEVVNQTRTTLEVLARHHGAEDVLRIDFESEYDADDMAMAIRALEFFNPELST